ncbi:thiamine phosphate synthase [Rubripirellula reticaptiva]|uniref:Thiamine-phosphate synthase n=1 Tax=Rubripirellula reticaptiva TaxID=2528013 RepID=A0A5C6F9U5_9BACT|nr:thiamine phosphate synthase [Rubripirellula reticaptiva]TWU58195.1 Thiamine-phosphate synthase [Rubripirellula reticaptiva]
MTEKTLRATYRILDASSNRALEGLRTMEEWARFANDDHEMSAELKSIRHCVANAVGRLPRSTMLAARDTPGDVGTEITVPTEMMRSSVASVVAAAAARTAQSLRVIEEYGKTIDGQLASEIERARYRTYTVAALLELSLPADDRQRRLAASSLYVLVDAGVDEAAFSESVRGLYQSGVDVLQLRDRSASDRTLLQRSAVAALIARQCGGLFIVNDRADLAFASDADGVHVGQEELPVADARRILGPDKLIGLSTHSIDQARDAVADGADYIGCGPVFAGRTKTFDRYVGPAFLQQVSAEIELPAFAIGGIDLTNLDQVTGAGIHRVAVTGAVRDADDPAEAVAELKRRLGKPVTK